MQETQPHPGKDVERISITDEPHERYQKVAPFSGEEIEPGIPILTSMKGGSVVQKDFTYYTVKCPECHIPAKYIDGNEPSCPECGIVCKGKDTILSEQLVRDAKAAGRIDAEGAQT